jgi:4-hydroxy-3-methylbut-2-enyl diphosphate reductase IspH
MREEQLDKGILAILDAACLSVGKVTDEVRTARQSSTGYTG